MSSNLNLNNAREAKDDEFYTQYDDIVKEVMRYKRFFEGKAVYCNCDDPSWSNFVRFFKDNFDRLRLETLYSTHLTPDGEQAYLYTLTRCAGGNVEGLEPIEGNGGFDTPPCKEVLRRADIVVTNPPFSLFRAFISTVWEAGVDLLVIGSENAVTYREVFPLIRDDRLWLGMNHVKTFRTPDGRIEKFGNIVWYTTLDHPLRHRPLSLYAHYYVDEKRYRRYDSHDTVYVDSVADIPSDYHGPLAVPITFLERYNPDQFEIVGTVGASKDTDVGSPELGGEEKFKRAVIRLKYDSRYVRYDGHDAIHVESVRDIPCDYKGVMSVPLTFLERYCPDQFEILGDTRYNDLSDGDINFIDGVRKFRHVLIRRR